MGALCMHLVQNMERRRSGRGGYPSLLGVDSVMTTANDHIVVQLVDRDEEHQDEESHVENVHGGEHELVQPCTRNDASDHHEHCSEREAVVPFSVIVEEDVQLRLLLVLGQHDEAAQDEPEQDTGEDRQNGGEDVEDERKHQNSLLLTSISMTLLYT